MAISGLLDSTVHEILFWSGALPLLLLVAAFWLVDLGERLRARHERSRHPLEAEDFEAAQRAAPALPALRSGRPRFRLGPWHRYLGQGRVNPQGRNGAT